MDNSSHIMLKGNLEFLDIIREALKITSKNTHFIIFSSLTSLPSLCFLVFYELILQKSFNETSTILRLPDHYYPKKLTRFLIPKLTQLLVLYLLPYHLLQLFNVATVVNASAKLYTEERQVGLRGMLRKCINKARLKGALITSTYVLFLSSSALLGLAWVITNYFIITRGFGSHYYYEYVYDMDYEGFFYNTAPRDSIVHLLIFICHGAVFAALLMKYMEWSAGWNMSVVISVLEEAYGSEAFEASAYFIRGSNMRGSFLMLVFFAWELVPRMPCLFGGCYQRKGGITFTFSYTCFICVGNVMKWVVCVVYFFDCKKRVLEKKVDVEIGKEGREVTEAST